MSKKILLDAPNIGRHEKRYLGRAIDAGYISTAGPFVPEFEKKFAAYLGVRGSVSTQSGTAALHVALHELGIGEGDEVIVPALTFVATISPVTYIGAAPVCVDVDLRTWNIDPSEISRHITGRTKAIIPVHLYGNPCDMDAIMSIARRHGLAVIEDAAEGLGARYGRAPVGTVGDFGCFSFNGNKIMTTGGGGMVVGKKQRALEHIRFLVNQARDESEGYYHPEVGFNYRMTNVEAALGLAQLGRLDGFLDKKRKFYSIYREELGDIPGVELQEEPDGAESSRWLVCAIFNGRFSIERLRLALKSDGIPTRRVFMPVTYFPHYKACGRGALENSQRIYNRGLCLPGSTMNSKDDIYRVCRSVKTRLKGLQR